MEQDKIEILERALKRERAARREAEKILEQKSAELYSANQKLEKSYIELEALLDKTDSQLQGVFENIVDAYVIIDLMGNILKMNDAAVDLLGFENTKENSNLLEFPLYEEKARVSEAFKNLLKNGAITNFHVKILTKKGEKKLVHVNASVIFDQGVPVAAQGIVRDVTEEKRYIRLVEEQKRELDVIVQNSSLGIVLGQKNKIIRTNETFQKLLGYSEEALLKMSIEDIVYEDNKTEIQRHLVKMNSGETDSFVINRRYLRKNGTIFWAKTSVNAVRDSLGNVKYRLALIEDITKERERALIVEMVDDITKAILGKVNIFEISSVVTSRIAEYLSVDYCFIYLVNSEENTIETITNYNSGSSEEGVKLPIGKGIVGSVIESGKAELVHNTDVDERYVVINKKLYSKMVVPIISNGKVIGVIDSGHTTKNYFSSKQLQTIEHVSGLIALQLNNAVNLRERQKIEDLNQVLFKKLEKSNNELQEYAHIVSHDLKSPLRSINALVSWLKMDNEDKFDKVSLQNLALIETTLEKMDTLISDVLEYSSIGSDNKAHTQVNLNTLISDLIQFLYTPDHINIEVLNDLPVIIGDKTKLQQLFQNLMSNAIKFIDKEDGFVKIDVEDIGSHYKFSIQDNGIGIEKKYHSKIFKVFQSVNKRKDSTGIGLSIVQKIVELHNGEIWLDSKLNKGTTFFFTLKKKK